MTQLPQAGFGEDHKEFKAFNDAVEELVKLAYGVENTWIACGLISPSDESDTQEDRYDYCWSAFLDGALGDPSSDSDTMLELDITMTPAYGDTLGYALAGRIVVHETLKWDYSADGPVKDAQARIPEIRSRILRTVWDAYLPTSEAFWAGFDVLRSLVHDGVVAGGKYVFPGRHGANLRLGMGWYEEYGWEDVYGLNYSVVVEPPDGSGPGPVADWDDLVRELPRPGFDKAFTQYKGAMLDAFQCLCGADPRVSVNRITYGAPEPGWQALGFTWFRAPTEEKPQDYRFESSEIEFLPADSLDGPLAQRAIITDLVAWGAQASGEARTPAIQALVPVRATILQAYLPLDDTFTEQLASLEFSNGLETDLTGLPGFTVHLKVEEVSQEEGRWRCRYSITWSPRTDSGG